MDKEHIVKIIEAGNLAPSGGNSQSWKFRVRGDQVDVIGTPEVDHEVLNIRNRGTYIGCGGVIENMEIAAKALGYKVEVDILPKEDVVATLSFSQSSKEDSLVDMIPIRHSNRKPYEPTPLSSNQKEKLLKKVDAFKDYSVVFVEGDQKQTAAECVAHDILLNLQNQKLHSLLFKEVLWNEEDQKHKPGLFVKTMETAPPKSYIFGLLKNWNVAKFFAKIGLIKKVYAESVNTATRSAAIGAIVVPDTDEGFVNAGRLLENVWLQAVKEGLSMQYIAGVVFLEQQVEYGSSDIFSSEERETIKNINKKLHDIFSVPKNKRIAMVFRIGKAEAPLATSYKRPPKIEWS